MTAVVYLLAAVGLLTLAAGAVFAVAPDWALDLIERHARSRHRDA